MTMIKKRIGALMICMAMVFGVIGPAGAEGSRAREKTDAIFNAEKNQAQVIKADGAAPQKIEFPKGMSNIYDWETVKDGFFYEYTEGTSGLSYHYGKYSSATGEMSELGSASIGYGTILRYQREDKVYVLVCKMGNSTQETTSGGEKVDLNTAQLFCLDMTASTFSEVAQFDSMPNYSGNFFVTGDGRLMRITKYKTIYEFNLNGGSYTNKIETSINLGTVVGFDDKNGNIYYTSSFYHTEWGYKSLYDGLYVANLSNGKIQVKNAPMTVHFQSEGLSHNGCTKMFGGGYLADLSLYQNDSLLVLDSSEVKIEDVLENVSSSVDMTMNTNQLPVLALSENTKALLLKISTRRTESPKNVMYTVDPDSHGVRGAINSSTGTLYVATEPTQISCVNIKARKITGQIATSKPVYYVVLSGDTLIAIEKDTDGAMYVEKFPVSVSASVHITGKTELNVGDTDRAQLEFGPGITPSYRFKSSDESVASISSKGLVSAWGEGKTTITVTSADETLSDSYTLTVKNTGKGAGNINGVHKLSGKSYYANSEYDMLTVYGSPVYSYLEELSDGSLLRVQLDNGKLLAETYSRPDLTMTSQKEIDLPLPIPGAFFKGTDRYYVVCGQKNEAMSDTAEVIRVIAYDSNWNEISHTSLSAINTVSPFEAGSCKLCETGGKLYIHTCHLMYDSHQANMTFVIDEATMTVADQYTRVMNLSEGYVSHSFNEFIRTDGTRIYRVDHGDAVPRGIGLSVTRVTDQLSRPLFYANMLAIGGGQGNNYTGLCLGGVELSEDSLLVAGNYNNTGVKETTKAFNVFVAESEFKADGGLMSPTRMYVTKYDSTEKIKMNVPRLVKLTGGHFLLLWEEQNTTNKKRVTKIAHVMPDGQIAGKIEEKALMVSDCQPVVLSDGSVSWWASDEKKRIMLYNINPYNLTGIKEDTDINAAVSDSKKPDDGNGNNGGGSGGGSGADGNGGTVDPGSGDGSSSNKPVKNRVKKPTIKSIDLNTRWIKGGAQKGALVHIQVLGKSFTVKCKSGKYQFRLPKKLVKKVKGKTLFCIWATKKGYKKSKKLKIYLS